MSELEICPKCNEKGRTYIGNGFVRCWHCNYEWNPVFELELENELSKEE